MHTQNARHCTTPAIFILFLFAFIARHRAFCLCVHSWLHIHYFFLRYYRTQHTYSHTVLGRCGYLLHLCTFSKHTHNKIIQNGNSKCAQWAYITQVNVCATTWQFNSNSGNSFSLSVCMHACHQLDCALLILYKKMKQAHMHPPNALVLKRREKKPQLLWRPFKYD